MYNIEVKEEAKELMIESDKFANELIIAPIVDDSVYKEYSSIIQDLSSREKVIISKRKEVTTQIDSLKKTIMNLFSPVLTKLSETKSLVNKELLDYTNKKEAERKEAERKAREKAEKEAEKERERLRKKAIKEAEKRKELEDKLKAETDETKKEVLESKIEEKLEKEVGFTNEASVISAAPVSIATQSPQVKGQYKKVTYIPSVENEDLVPREYCTPDLAYIKKMINASKGKLKIPGISVRVDEKIVTRKD